MESEKLFGKTADFLLRVPEILYACGKFMPPADTLLRLRILHQERTILCLILCKSIDLKFYRVKCSVWIITNTSYIKNLNSQWKSPNSIWLNSSLRIKTRFSLLCLLVSCYKKVLCAESTIVGSYISCFVLYFSILSFAMCLSPQSSNLQLFGLLLSNLNLLLRES